MGRSPINTVKPSKIIEAVEIEIGPKLREKLQEYSQLYDFYGSMLTDRQNTCFTMHYLEDLSLSEIGEALSITPQAVADQVKRTVGILRRYEEKLSLVKSWRNQQNQIEKITNALSGLIKEGYPLEALRAMIEEL